jgi:molybdate transport repressor ModE-like protein
MTPHQLNVLRTVAQAGSITAAAKELVVSVAAVSASVGELERDLGTPLLEREGRGVRLTDAGQVLTRYAEELRTLLAVAREETQRVGGRRRRDLRIGAVTTAGEELVPRWIEQFLLVQPNFEVTLQVANSEDIFAALLDREIDLAIGGRPPFTRAIRVIAERPHHLVVIASPSEPPVEPSGDFHHLSDRRWLLREEGSGTRINTLELFARHQLAPTTVRIASNRAIIRAVRAGLGISLVSSDSISEEVSRGELQILKLPPTPLERRWLFSVRADETMTEPVAALIAQLERSSEIQTTTGITLAGEIERMDLV